MIHSAKVLTFFNHVSFSNSFWVSIRIFSPQGLSVAPNFIILVYIFIIEFICYVFIVIIFNEILCKNNYKKQKIFIIYTCFKYFYNDLTHNISFVSFFLLPLYKISIILNGSEI